ncbi:MAG TPA: isochorismatase family protein [Hyphomicrobiales bacterium]|nr:isochorismatase family protein [Hyphomicrobiales bacterium]
MVSADEASDTAIFDLQKFGQPMGFGRSAALLVIDFTRGFCDPMAFGGGNIEAAAANTVSLLEEARRLKLPVAHTRIIYAADGSDANIHCLKVPRLQTLTRDNPLSEFADGLVPRAGEIVIEKRLPSGFFGTDLAGMLVGRRVDTLVIAGCTTSGCVRASTLDAMCHGFRPMVVADCVGDRAEAPHRASLFDLGKKYADIITKAEALAGLRRLADQDAAPAGQGDRKIRHGNR